MSIPGNMSNIAYITLNGRIPSTTANSVGVMTMCGQFARQGLDVMLLVPDGQGMPLKQLGGARDVFEFYSVAAPFEFKRFPNAFSLLSRFASPYSLALVLYARARGFTLITTRALEVAVWAARLNMPVILESHNFSKFEKHRMIGSWVSITRQAGKTVSMVVTTKAGKASYESIGVPQERIRVLPNGVDVSRYQTSDLISKTPNIPGFDSSKPTVTFSGSMQHGKGVEEFIESAAFCLSANFLLIGGSQEQLAYYRDLVNQKKISNVFFTGHVRQAEVPNYLMSSQVLVLPNTSTATAHSVKYTSPMKMFDYLASGKPIVATDLEVFREVLEHGRNALLVPPDSGEALAQGVQYLLDNPEFARSIGAVAKADAQRYSWAARAGAVIAWQRQLGHLA